MQRFCFSLIEEVTKTGSGSGDFGFKYISLPILQVYGNILSLVPKFIFLDTDVHMSEFFDILKGKVRVCRTKRKLFD